MDFKTSTYFLQKEANRCRKLRPRCVALREVTPDQRCGLGRKITHVSFCIFIMLDAHQIVFCNGQEVEFGYKTIFKRSWSALPKVLMKKDT